MFALVQHTEIPHPLGITTLVTIYLCPIILSILFISLLTNPGYGDQDPIVLVFSIQAFRKCMTGMFIIFMADDIIRDYIILEENSHSHDNSTSKLLLH